MEELQRNKSRVTDQITHDGTGEEGQEQGAKKREGEKMRIYVRWPVL